MNIGFSLACPRVQGPGGADTIADKWRLRPKGSTVAKAMSNEKESGGLSTRSFRDAAISAFTRVFDALRRRARNPDASGLPVVLDSAFAGFARAPE
jgi:hypothetical protein